MLVTFTDAPEMQPLAGLSRVTEYIPEESTRGEVEFSPLTICPPLEAVQLITVFAGDRESSDNAIVSCAHVTGAGGGTENDG